MVLRSDFSFSKDNENNEQSIQKCNKNIENFEVKKQENIQTNLEYSDSEYDMLFEKMQVISNTEDKKLIEKKRKKINKKDLSDAIISHKSELKRKGKAEKLSKIKKIKILKST